jgi:hypothetical protein
MTGPELIALLQDPAVRDAAQRALGLPTEPVALAQQRMEEAITALASAQQRTEATVRDLASEVRELASAQQRTDASVKELAAAQQQTDASVKELAAAQRRTDASVKDLAWSHQQTDAALKELAWSHGQTDATVKALAMEVKDLTGEVKDLSHEVTELVESQRTGFAELRRAVGALSDNVGFGLEELAAIVLPGVLEREERVQVDRFTRRVVGTDAGEEEIDVFGEGERDGTSVPIVGEVKSRIYSGDVRKFAAKLERIGRSFSSPPLGLMFGFMVHPAANDAALALGIRVVASRPG